MVNSLAANMKGSGLASPPSNPSVVSLDQYKRGIVYRMANKKASKRQHKVELDEQAKALRQSRIRLLGIALVAFLLLAFALSGVLYSQTHPASPTPSSTLTPNNSPTPT